MLILNYKVTAVHFYQQLLNFDHAKQEQGRRARKVADRVRVREEEKERARAKTEGLSVRREEERRRREGT